MASPGRALKTYSEIPSDTPALFRFEVTWRSLTPAIGRTAFVPGATAVVAAPARIEPPPFALPPPHFASVGGPGSQRRRKALLCAALLAVSIVIGAILGLRSAKPGEAAATTTDMGEAGWISEWVSDATGSARGRQLSLYRPSNSMSDFRFEFTGQIARQSLGWAFRVADTRNYYVGKLGFRRSGGPLTFTRFAVVGGVEGSRHETPIRLAIFPLSVKLEAQGSQFKLYVQKQIVEEWEDSRLKTGSLGFLNERQEQGQVESVQISFLKPGVRP